MSETELRAAEDASRLSARLAAAEHLLEEADTVIELLLGNRRHQRAEEVCAAIAEHFDKYDAPAENTVSAARTDEEAAATLREIVAQRVSRWRS